MKRTPGAVVTPAIQVNTDHDPLHKEDDVRNPVNYDRNAATRRTSLACKDPSLTTQEFAEEVNINYIAERYGLTGEMPLLTGANAPTWGGNFNEVFDFMSAQNAVVKANQDFMTLPAKLRTRFGNDPAKLLAFLEDPENRKEAEFLGLVTPRPVESNLDAPDKPEGHSKGAPSPSDTPTGKKGASNPPSKPPKTDTE